MKNKYYTFNKKRYRLELRDRKVRKTQGECDSPDTRGRKILLYTKGIRAKTFMIAAIHESLHALDFQGLSESKVDKWSKAIGRLLWGLNYRRKKDKK